MAWYLIIAIAVAYLLIGAVVVVLLEEILEEKSDEFPGLVIFWPVFMIGTLLVLGTRGLMFLVRSGIKKMLKKK